MNIVSLIAAIRHLDEAASLTLGKDERGSIEVAAKVMRKLLQRRGVFVGAPQKPYQQVTPHRWKGQVIGGEKTNQ